MQANILDRIMVCLNDAIQSITLGVEDVTIQCKAVGHTSLLFVLKNVSSEAKSRNILVLVVVLKDAAKCLDSLKVFVFAWIQVMQ